MARRRFRFIIRSRKVLRRIVDAPVIAVQRLVECMDAEHWILVTTAIVFLSMFYSLSYRLSQITPRREIQERHMEELEPQNPPCTRTCTSHP